MKPKFIYFLPAIIWFLLIFTLLMLPGDDLPKEDFLSVIYFDKWVHAGLFGGLVFLVSYPLRNSIGYKSLFYLNIVMAAIGYGIAMEFAQKYLTADRDFDVNDMIADAVGAILGYFFFRFVALKVSQKNKPL